MNRIELSESQVKAAYTIAIIADVLQLPLTAVSATGIFTIPAELFDFFFDCIVMAVLWLCLGFHWLLLPAMAGETFPGLDLLPTWTASVALLVKIRRDEATKSAGPHAPTSGVTRKGPIQAAEPPPLPPPLETTIQTRLKKLNELFEERLISPEEYEAKRQQILSEV